MTEANTMGYISDSQYRENMSNDYHASRMTMAGRLLDRIAPLAGKSAYDYGCGDGAFMRLLASRGMRAGG